MLKSSINLAVVAVVSLFIFAGFSYSADYKYIGIQKCQMCHKGEKGNKVFEKWQSTKHASAYKSLLTEKAKEVAKKKGLKVEPSEAEECLRCHVSGYLKGETRDASLKKEDGVGCESCHGAASAYVLKHNKDKAEGHKLGMKPKALEIDACKKCHNNESPTFVAKFYEQSLKNLEVIKHWK